MKTLSATSLKPKTSTTTTTVDYYVRQELDDGESGALVKNFRNQFPETERDIQGLMVWPAERDRYDTPRPNPDSVTHARSWAEQLYRDVSTELWLKPRVSVDEDGNVVFEWWRGLKKLSAYISPTTVEYVKVEKAGPSLRMEDGTIETSGERRMLWRWLIS